MAGLKARSEKAQKLPNEAFRWLCRNDLYFLLRYGLQRPDCDNDWVFDRCIEVQEEPDGHLDLWAREHYKSTIITFTKTIQDILIDPEVTVGIFSHTRPISKAFLRQIKREFESNELLKSWFPDILWANPQKDSPKWSEDDGITVIRKTNPKEATIEAWGVVDGQPTSKHYRNLIYDDVVTKESVTSPEMMAKTVDALALSYNLGAHGGIRRFIGTRYHFNDAYRTVIDRGTVKLRVYPATVDGTVDGEPVFLDRATLAEKRRDFGPYVFACQMLQDPKADEVQGFKKAWLKHAITTSTAGMNIYMVVDPASAKKKTSDYTAAWVVGLAADRNIYVLDIVRDRLSLTQRADMVMNLHRRWHPISVGYERYGMMADIEHIRDRQERENYRFRINELGGTMPKNDRIRRLIPLFEQGRIYIPHALRKTNYEGISVDVVKEFIDQEYMSFPVAVHDDMLDALARIMDDDMGIAFPASEHDYGDDYRDAGSRSAHTGY